MDPQIAASLIWSVIFGVICARMATKRQRDPIGWAIGGAIFGLLAVLALWCMPTPPRDAPQA